MGYLKLLVVLILTTVNSFALRAEYRFEDCNGIKNSKDFQGDSNLDGVLRGDAKIDTGKIKYGLSLNGNGGMFISHSTKLDLVDNLTISFWVNPKKREREALIVRGGGKGDDREFGSRAEYSLVLWEDGRFKYKHNGTADTFSKTILPLNRWSHIVLVRDNGLKKISIYINGELDITNSYTIDPSSSNSEDLIIGSGDYYSDTMQNFQGSIDEIKIYNTALSSSEISKMYSVESRGIYYTKECKVHTPPEAVGDSSDLPVGGEVLIDVLLNDSSFDGCELNSSSIQLYSDSSLAILSDNNKTLTMPKEGVWSVDSSRGLIRFVSDRDFYDNPTPIYYRVSDSCGAWSNRAIVSLSRVVIDSTTSPSSTPTPTPAPTSTLTPTPTPTSMPTLTPTPTSVSPATSGDSSNTNSNGNSSNLKLGDRVWVDSNRNGIQDNGEVGLKGVVVVLLDSDSQKIDSTTTNANGNYIFSGLGSGEYSIQFQNIPNGCKFTLENIGKDDTKDSDVDINGNIFGIDLKDNDLTRDAGVICQNGNTVAGESCDCDDYESSVPSLNGLSTIFTLLLFAILGFFVDSRKSI